MSESNTLENEPRSITQAEFAKQIGVQISYIGKLVRAGKIASDKSCKPARVLLDDPITVEWLKTRDENKKVKGSKHRIAASTLGRLNDIDVDDLAKLPESVLKQVKTLADARKTQLQTDIMRGKYIPRKTVESFYSQLIAVDNSVMKTLGQSLATEIATVFESLDSEKIIKIQTLIDNAVYTALKLRQGKMDSWLTSNKGDHETE